MSSQNKANHSHERLKEKIGLPHNVINSSTDEITQIKGMTKISALPVISTNVKVTLMLGQSIRMSLENHYIVKSAHGVVPEMAHSLTPQQESHEPTPSAHHPIKCSWDVVKIAGNQ